MGLCIDTDAAIIDAIDESVLEAFSVMAGATLTRRDDGDDSSLSEGRKTEGEQLTVVLGLSGDLQGSLSLTMNESAARRWTKSLIDIDVDEIDQTVIDAVGELGNIVVGGAKRRMNDFNLTMSLPSVIRVGIEQLNFQSNAVPLRIAFDFGPDVIQILVALNKQTGSDLAP